MSPYTLPAPPHRSRVDHVIPYGDQSGMDLTTNYSVSERVTRQELDMMLGLLLGVCACCLLLWLNGALQCVLAAWRDQQPEGQSTTGACNVDLVLVFSGVGSWSWLTGLSDLGSWYRWMHHRQVDDSTRNIVHVKQALYHNGHPSL
ncbi:hypothetical protein NHX12_029581 [Muraenolepis orangiensis]|uniref:Uncharacterized protein n=1 Tax=Muraenolepis orangiensis TaxID=630683 RepID=A0A9Q0ECA3_9TELE|nr:hypothetical protein NHX12_029581 [Muraenolepis orangiensis]